MSKFEDEYYMDGGEGDDEETPEDVDEDDDDEVIEKKETEEDDDDDDDDDVDDEGGSLEDDYDDESNEAENDDDDDDDEQIIDKKSTNIAAAVNMVEGENDEYDSSDSEDDSSDDENFTKVDDEFKFKFMKSIHPEEFDDDYNSMKIFTEINRDKDNIIVDKHHKTLPLLTKYEKARILGLRIAQLNKGAQPFIKFTNEERNVIDTHIIAEKELREKRLPFIIMRPIPNGKKEYWSLQDLEIIDN
jgi:DNA-directed RNA polymerase subunit K/omega